MSSKAQARRNKRKAKPQAGPAPTGAKAIALRAVAKRQSMKPTAERRARGVWIDGKAAEPSIDLANDMAGALFQGQHITHEHLEAARSFQEVRAAYVSELGTTGYRSCLAGGVGGHDDGDGNPQAFEDYRRITKGLTAPQVRVLEVGLDLSPEGVGSVTIWKVRDALGAMTQRH